MKKNNEPFSMFWLGNDKEIHHKPFHEQENSTTYSQLKKLIQAKAEKQWQGKN